MSVSFDFDKLGRLLANFYKISGVRYSLADTDNNLLCFSNDFSDFCNAMNASPEGHARCKKCDQDALSTVKSSSLDAYTYRCHAGLLETVIPIRGQGEIIGYIFFGQMSHNQNLDDQWHHTRRCLSAWHTDPDTLYDSFLKLKQVDDTVISSCAEILQACCAYIWMDAVIKSSPQTDVQRLTAYLDEHYAEAPTLDQVAHALNMSKTKLCSIAAKQNTTVNAMLSARQMEAAKSLLANTDHRISEISGLVGIRDYNYFTKVFKVKCGVTPSDYRKVFAVKVEHF